MTLAELRNWAADDFLACTHQSMGQYRTALLLVIDEVIAGNTLPFELRGIAETVANSAGFWTSCTGCYDTEDGRPTQKYAHSKVFGCEMGSGCSECGGLGVVWDDTDYEEMARFMADNEAAPAAPAPTTRDEIEARQRAAMKTRFAGRPTSPATADFDLPAPNDAAPAPAAQAYKPELTFEQWIESVPPLTWNGWGRREAAHAAWLWLEKRHAVLAARQQSATPADAASEADKRDAERYRAVRACGSEWSELSVFDARGHLDAEFLDEAADSLVQRERQQGADDA
jgi:hypothetical protein